MPDIERIDPDQARRRAQSGTALLVCAYDDEAKCDRVRLEGAIALRELERRAVSLPKEQELVFYCA